MPARFSRRVSAVLTSTCRAAALAAATVVVSGCTQEMENESGTSGYLAGALAARSGEPLAFDPVSSQATDPVTGSPSPIGPLNSLQPVPSTQTHDPVAVPPALQCPPSLTIDCSAGQGQAEIDAWLASAAVASGCADVVVANNYADVPRAPTMTITFTAKDNCGVAECVATLAIVNAGPPLVEQGKAVELWPPNHKYVTLTLGDFGVRVVDPCLGERGLQGARVVSVSSDEPESGGGDGGTTEDIRFGEDGSIQLRAERQGGGNGRVYTIHFEVDGLDGGVISGAVQATVPHDKSGVAIDDGPAAGYSVVKS